MARFILFNTTQNAVLMLLLSLILLQVYSLPGRMYPDTFLCNKSYYSIDVCFLQHMRT